MKRLRGKLTYANVISTVCLFLLLGGGAAFAATQLPKNSVGSKQIKKEAVTPAKLSTAAKATLTGPKGATGATGPAGAKGDKGEKGDKGDKGERGLTGEAGSALAFASIEADGTVEVENSKGITQANVEVPATGIYCLSGLGFTPKVAIVSPNAVGPVDGILANPVVKAPSNGLSGCAGEAQVRIHITTAAAPTTLSSHPFYIILN
jgi:hypothetical protein